jgi:hypothetical protein
VVLGALGARLVGLAMRELIGQLRGAHGSQEAQVRARDRSCRDAPMSINDR